MVRIRFRRHGLKRQPHYRIVVTDQRSPRDGRFIEIIGYHNPRTRPETDVVDEARALHWLSVGAQPTEAVRSVFRRTGTLDRFARLRQGEALEALVAEREKELEEAEPISPKTSYPSPGPGEGKNSKLAAAEAETADAVDQAEAEAAEEPAE